jgi:hypothetical protein
VLCKRLQGAAIVCGRATLICDPERSAS